MKKIKLIFIIPCLLVAFSACQKDNYQQPDATISGALTDAEIGGPLSLSQNGGGGSVRTTVNDKAKYPAPTNNDYVLKSDGTYYNSRVFSENYIIYPLAGSGPWQYTKVTAPAYAPTKNPLTLAGDTLNITIAPGQNTVTNFKVYPYFRLTLSMVDTTATVTITRSAAATANVNDFTTTNNLVIVVNNYPIVNSNVSSNTTGYYINKWNFTIDNRASASTKTWANSTTQFYTFGTPLTLPITTTAGGVVGIKWAATHLPKGTYYWRASIVGGGSNGAPNWSNTVQAVVH